MFPPDLRSLWVSFKARLRRPPRVIAFLQFHDEIRFLPGWFRNVAPLVDGVIALDDGSTDGSGEFVAAQPSLLELIRIPPRTPHVWDEVGNKLLLHEASRRHKPDWIVVVDADERLERGFRERARREIAKAEAAGIQALSIDVCELWDSYGHYRVDGIWGVKRFGRLFRFRPDAEVDRRRYHGHWTPLNSMTGPGFPRADLRLYHLKMVHAAWREARRARYEALDPNCELQAIGYAYLTDPTGLELRALEPGREFHPPGLGEES